MMTTIQLKSIDKCLISNFFFFYPRSWFWTRCTSINRAYTWWRETTSRRSDIPSWIWRPKSTKRSCTRKRRSQLSRRIRISWWVVHLKLLFYYRGCAKVENFEKYADFLTEVRKLCACVNAKVRRRLFLKGSLDGFQVKQMKRSSIGSSF